MIPPENPKNQAARPKPDAPLVLFFKKETFFFCCSGGNVRGFPAHGSLRRLCLPSGKQPDALGHQAQSEGDDEDRAALEQIFVVPLREECAQ